MDGLEALRTVERVRQRSATRGRAFAWLNLWTGIMMGGYLALFAALVSLDATGDTGQMLLPAVLLHGSLIEGAKERAGVHRQLRAVDIVMLVLAVILIVAVMAVAIVATPPWWFAPVVGATGLLLFSAIPAARLARIERARSAAAPAPGDDWPVEPLGRPASCVTLGAAVILGAVAAGQGGPVISLAIIVVVFVLVVIALAAKETSWSLAGAGLAWGRRHWAGFGASVLLLFADIGVIASVGPQPLPVALAVGAVVAAPLTLSALPRRAR